MSAGARFCSRCGARVDPFEAPQQAAARAAQIGLQPGVSAKAKAETIADERKTVSALFADIKGSTELMRDLDPEEAQAIVDPALKIMVEAVRRYEGYVVQSTGDGIFALFGAPVAHEDHPQRALYAALQMQHELRRLSARSAQGRAALEARIGVNTGEVVVRTIETGGKLEYTPIGHTANLASRLQSVAPAGSIAIGDETQRLVEGYFELRALGPTEVKGVGDAINVYEVIGPGPLRTHFQLAARRGLTRFVGRERELAAMQHALALARGGHGQAIAVMAEAGTGKSRLFYEFKATLPSECKLLEAYSVSHGKASAWLPVLELLRGYFGIEDADDAVRRREKVRAVLGALDPALAETLPYLFGLLGIVEGADPLAQMDPQIRRQRTLDALKRVIVRESLAQPTVVIFEDLHWIDEQTQALLDLLVESIAGARVLLLVNYRPEYQHQWSGKGHYMQIGLNPLGPESAQELLAALLEDAVELRPLKRLIIERTGGNPFFIEEMVQALFDQGALVRNGAVKVTRSLSQLRLPTTVQGMLAARIDRQPGDHKQLLQTLAVLGRESSLGLIAQVASHTDTELEGILAALKAREFIYDQPVASGVEFVFKHALTQEVAYNSLLIERRKQIHERVGQALEWMFAWQLDDHLGELAHHYSHSDNVDKAVEYLGRSGQQAMQRSAHADAVNNLTLAIDLLQKLPDTPGRIQRELPLQMSLGQAFMVLKGWAAQEVERAFTRARKICADLGDPPETFPVLFGLAGVNFIRGRHRRENLEVDISLGGERVVRVLERLRTDETYEQLFRGAQSSGHPTPLLLAHYGMGNYFHHAGEFLLAREHQNLVLSLYEQERDGPLAFTIGVDLRQGTLSYAGRTLWKLGYPDQAVEMSKEAILAAQRLSHPNSLAAAEFFFVIVRLFRREPHLVQEGAERVIALSAEHGLGAWLQVPFYRGWAIAQQGHEKEGIAQMRNTLDLVHAAGVDIGRASFLCQLAEVYGNVGRLDDGLSLVAEALAAVDEQGERFFEAEAHRLKGELLLLHDKGAVGDATDCFREAIEVAQHQSAKSFELLATTSLARLLASQGRRDEARSRLAETYNWFTEGFDTADLKDAKSLLDKLSE